MRKGWSDMHILQEGVDLNTSFCFKLALNRSWGTYYWALQITYSMNMSQDESMLSCFLHFQMSQQESRLIRPENIFPTSSSIVHFCWVCVNCSFSFLFIADGSGTQCGLCCRVGIVWHLAHSEVTFYIRMFWQVVIWVIAVSLSSKKSGYSTLTSGICKAFSLSETLLTGYFLSFQAILSKP